MPGPWSSCAADYALIRGDWVCDKKMDRLT
jgi:hypothetical protein